MHCLFERSIQLCLYENVLIELFKYFFRITEYYNNKRTELYFYNKYVVL